MESWQMAVDRVGRYAGSWSNIQWSNRNHENEAKTSNLGWMLYSVYAVLGVCCTQCILYSVYAVLGVYCTRCMLYSVYDVLGVCCTRYMLYSVYAVLGVCCPRCQLMIMSLTVREGSLNFVFCDDGWVVDEKEGDGGWGWERYGGYERIRDISGTTCLIGLGRPRMSIGLCLIGTRTSSIGDGQLTRTRNSLSPSSSWWFPPSPLISLFLVLNSTIT